jgi:antitoxin component of MazEF toxin-antitoxin module
MLQTRAVVSLWGNSQAVRLPAEMIRQRGIQTNDEVVLQVIDDTLTITKPSTPKEGTIEYLFKDYSGESFQTELLNPIEPVGEEKW